MPLRGGGDLGALSRAQSPCGGLLESVPASPSGPPAPSPWFAASPSGSPAPSSRFAASSRSEEHTSELQSRFDLVCRLLLEKKKIQDYGAASLQHTPDSRCRLCSVCSSSSSLFCFSSSDHLRDLHSFPTRRSSDLQSPCGGLLESVPASPSGPPAPSPWFAASPSGSPAPSSRFAASSSEPLSPSRSAAPSASAGSSPDGSWAAPSRSAAIRCSTRSVA